MALTSLSEMIAFKKAGHDTSASLAKMLWPAGTNLKRDTPEKTAQAVKEEIAYQQDADEYHNEVAANNAEYGREDIPTRGVDVPKNTEHVTSPNDWAMLAAEEEKQRLESAKDYLAEGPYEMEEPSMEEILDAQYRLDHPEDNEGVPPEKDKALVGS